VAEAENTDFIGYLNTLYNFSIAIAAILAVFMIALGSFSYIFTSAGNTSKMLDAKEMIKNAIIGLALVLVAFLILFIINPDLVKGTILAPSQVIQEINK
jgi:formate/nitrite transporter FocA (FNT family)